MRAPAAPPARVSIGSTYPLTVLALAAAVLAAHLEAAIQAVQLSLPLGGFLFAVSGLVVAWSVWARRSGARRVAGVGAAGFAALALLWLASRSIGLPIAGGLRAPVGPLDLMTAVDELLLVAICIAWASGRSGGARALGTGYVALCLSLMLISMGCSVGQASGQTQAWAASHGAKLYCHLL